MAKIISCSAMDENSKEKENESQALMARIQQLERGTIDLTL